MEFKEDRYNIATYFFKEGKDYEIIVRKQVNVVNRNEALEKINNYNKVYSKLQFYLESNEIYAIHSFQQYENAPKEFINAIGVAIDFISSNDI